jgi:hypothetical protein
MEDSKMKKTKPELIIIAWIVVLVGAYGIGSGIRYLRFMSAQTTPQTKIANAEQQINLDVNKPAPNVPETEYVVVQEPVEEPNEQPIDTAEEQWQVEPENQRAQNVIQNEQDFQNQQLGGNMQWEFNQQWFDWANTLTDEQRARLQRGSMLMWQRWQNLSDQDAQAEQARMMEMMMRWQNMNDTQRQQAMQRIQQQLLQWLQTDQEEFPEFSLD